MGRGFFLSSLRRQLSGVIVVFIILFTAIVVPWLVEIPSHYYDGSYESNITDYFLRMFADGIYRDGVISNLTAVFLGSAAFACAVSAARYLHSMKMTDLYHSLPIRREKLLLINSAVSMLVVLGPFLLIYAGVILWQVIAYGRFGWLGSWYWSFAIMDFMTVAIMVFVIYTLTTLTAVCVGTTFDAIAISGTAGFAPPLICLIAGGIWETTTYGAVASYDYLMRISPFLFFFERGTGISYDSSVYYTRYDYGSIATLFGVWLIIGIAMGALAVYCYRRRKSELAEQTQPHGVLQTAMKCFAAYCGSAFFLLAFQDHPLPVKIIVILLASTGIGLIAELIFSRGIRAVSKNIKVLGLSGAVLSILFVALCLDLFGFESGVPPAQSVESVAISYRGRFAGEVGPDVTSYYSGPAYAYSASQYTNVPSLSGPGSIDIVLDVHKSIIADDKDGKNSQSYSHGYMNYLSIEYALKNGRTVTRRYTDVTRETWARLAALETQPDFIANNHPVFWMDAFREKGILKIDATIESAAGNEPKPLTLTRYESEALLDAVKADMLALTKEAIFEGEPVKGYLSLTFWVSPEGNVASDQHLTGTIITLTESYRSTLSLLESYGQAELLTPRPEGIAEVRMTDCIPMLYSETRVTMASSGDYSYRLADEYIDDSYNVFTITDPDEISSLIQNGRSSILVSEEIAQSVLTMQFVGEDGQMLATQFVRLEDIPERIRSEVSAYLNEQYALMKPGAPSGYYDPGYKPYAVAEADAVYTA
jgi:hypothetical protein